MGCKFGDSPDKQLYALVNLMTTIICSFASLLTIYIIHRMKNISDHVLILLWMSYFQLAYDVMCFTANVDCGYYWTVASYFNHNITGTAVCLISNWMTFAAFNIVLFRSHFETRKNATLVLSTSVLPGFAAAIFYAVVSIPQERNNEDLQHIAIVEVVNNIRLASIILNFFFVFIILYQISRTASKGRRRTPEEKAIRTLAARMIFYPIMQGLSRSFYAWYELEYGVNRNFDNLTPEKYACLMLLSISTPMVSVGYLIIFLLMQPKAYKNIKVMLGIEKDVGVDDNDNDDDNVTQDGIELRDNDSMLVRKAERKSSLTNNKGSIRSSRSIADSDDSDVYSKRSTSNCDTSVSSRQLTEEEIDMELDNHLTMDVPEMSNTISSSKGPRSSSVTSSNPSFSSATRTSINPIWIGQIRPSTVNINNNNNDANDRPSSTLARDSQRASQRESHVSQLSRGDEDTRSIRDTLSNFESHNRSSIWADFDILTLRESMTDPRLDAELYELIMEANNIPASIGERQ